ncbi:MAG: peptidase U32 family protein, partial [Clostridia bacterium]
MDYEILSPAGSVESLITAVMCNADAVYLGLEKFNARQNAQNFNRDNFAEWVNYCHLFGTKVYVTINTSIKQNEFKDALDLLNFVYANFADGVILTDLALIKYAGRKLKGLDIIASTQLNVNNVLGAKYLESLGVSTVVVARECKIEDIEQIKAQTKLKIEVFIHGALCVCQSGQCLFSSIVGGNSGNRGLCAQPCRKLYTATDKLGRKLNNGYLLSCSDLCGLNIAKKLFNAGATSFKIEGRNRRREYVGQTTLTYKRLFSNNFKFTSNDESDLKSIFNRGDYTEGYYSGRNDKIICPDIPSHKGLYCGKLFNNNTISECQFPIVKGDAFK